MPEEISGSTKKAGSLVVVDNTGTSHLISSGDMGKLVRYTNAGLVSVVLTGPYAIGTTIKLLAWGLAGIDISGDSSMFINAFPSGHLAQYKEATCTVVGGSGVWSVQGDIT